MKFVAPIAFAATLALVACGGGEETDAEEAMENAAESTQEAAEETMESVEMASEDAMAEVDETMDEMAAEADETMDEMNEKITKERHTKFCPGILGSTSKKSSLTFSSTCAKELIIINIYLNKL